MTTKLPKQPEPAALEAFETKLARIAALALENAAPKDLGGTFFRNLLARKGNSHA